MTHAADIDAIILRSSMAALAAIYVSKQRSLLAEGRSLPWPLRPAPSLPIAPASGGGTTGEFVQDLRERVLGSPEISAGGFTPDQPAICDAFNNNAHGHQQDVQRDASEHGPGMALGLADCPWSLGELIEAALAVAAPDPPKRPRSVAASSRSFRGGVS